MSGFSIARLATRDWHKSGHLLAVALAGGLSVAAVALVAYLLWPTWGANGMRGPERLPVSVGGTLFNVPAAAIRMKIQRHSGPQERDRSQLPLSRRWTPPDAPKHVSADTVEEEMAQPIDRIFLSIAAHQNALAPEAARARPSIRAISSRPQTPVIAGRP